MSELIMMLGNGIWNYEITLGIILVVWPVTYLIFGSEENK